MDKTMSAYEADRTSSHGPRKIRNGERSATTNHDEGVAALIRPDNNRRARQDASDRLLERLGSQSSIDIGPWTRDDLYDDDEGEQRAEQSAGQRAF